MPAADLRYLLLPLSLITLSGCIPSLPLSVDATTAADLPPDVALAWLRAAPRDMAYQTKFEHPCDFSHDEGPVLNGAIVPWRDMEALAWWHGSRTGGAYAVIKMKSASDIATTKRCYAMAIPFAKLGVKPPADAVEDAGAKLRKTLTALDSLGVAMPDDLRKETP